MATIYKATCMISGKCYVGRTALGLAKRKLKHLYDAANGSSYYFHRAIQSMAQRVFLGRFFGKEMISRAWKSK